MSGYDPIARQLAQNAVIAAEQAIALAEVVAVQAWAVVNTNVSPPSGAQLSVDTTLAPVTITLPAGGGNVMLRDNAGTWGTNPVTVVGNGANFAINNAATLTLDAPGFQLNFAQIGGVWLFTLQFLNGVSA